MAYVYRHIRLDTNQVFYIGIGSSPYYKRAKSKLDRNDFWKRIVNKTDYKVEILFDNLTKEEAIEKEIEFIALYGRSNLGKGTLCNLTNGGEGTNTLILSDASRAKMSKSQMGNTKYLLRTTPQEEINKKISQANKGKIRTEEFKQKIKDHQLKNGNPSLGRIQSNETREKISNTKEKFSVVQKDFEGNIVKIWESTKSVKQGGFYQSSVWKCCHNVQIQHRGFKWSYLKDNKQ
jgi:NUMOD3 motif